MEPETAGDPLTTKKWTHQTAQRLAECLEQTARITVSASVVRRLLGQIEYSLKSNRKCLTSGTSPYRDQQFQHIQSLRTEFTEAGEPIISVDTKKKELIGLFKNTGRTWCRDAVNVNDHDFPSLALGRAVPYGIYDLQHNHGVLVMGQSADTPEFAVNSVVTWWHNHGQHAYPSAHRLLILADSGGSNGCRPRVWKKYLQEKLADQYGLTIVVAHYPTGTSKWNPVEHRLFSEISKNWAGEPLRDYDTLLNFARKTTTTSGLTVDAYHDQEEYKKGQTVSDKEMDQLALERTKLLGQWNYTIQPRMPILECRVTDQREDLESLMINNTAELSTNKLELALV